MCSCIGLKILSGIKLSLFHVPEYLQALKVLLK